MITNAAEAARSQPWGGGFEITYNNLRTGACPRCNGTLQLCRDIVGYYRKCLNCSRETPAGIPDRSTRSPTETPRTHPVLAKV